MRALRGKLNFSAVFPETLTVSAFQEKQRNLVKSSEYSALQARVVQSFC
jgi:hypothetical protein